jgi:hypothetical protein
MSGLHPHSEGTLHVDGSEVRFSSPRESLDHGIATVYQDLAVVSLMEVWRNFFLGSELRKGTFPLAPLDIPKMRSIADSELKKMGIAVKDINQPIGTLSGGQRQCVAIARAVYFGARVLILDEPTAALGVKQSGVVLKYTAAARDAGPGRRVHHPQPAPRLPGRRPLHHPQARASRPRQDPRRGHARGAHPRDGRRAGARRALARAAALRQGEDAVTVNVGVIGVGMIGQDHIRRLTTVLSGPHVAAVADVDSGRAEEVARSLRDVRVHRTGEELIADPAVDGVVVASWGPSHEEFVLGCIEAGKPVFCEKPLATTQEACLHIIDAEVAHGRRLVQVGYMRRYDPPYRSLKDAVTSGAIGVPLIVHSGHRNPSVPSHYTRDMAIVDTAVHDIDVVRWLLDEEIAATTVLAP